MFVLLYRIYDVLVFGRPPWWLFPAILFLLGLATWLAALALSPGADEFCYVFGMKFGEECGFKSITGLPCPQCGMTRSFVWAARLHLLKSFWYSPAGFSLFVWVEMSAIVGAVRLLTRDPKKLAPRWQWLVGWTLFWMIGLYFLTWVGRLAGLNQLPELIH